MIYGRAGEAIGGNLLTIVGVWGVISGLARSLLGRPASRVYGRLMATRVERPAGVCHWSCSWLIKGGVEEADRYGEVVVFFPFNTVMVLVVLCFAFILHSSAGLRGIFSSPVAISLMSRTVFFFLNIIVSF